MRAIRLSLFVVTLLLPQCKTGDGSPGPATVLEADDAVAPPIYKKLPVITDEAAFLDAATKGLKKGGVPADKLDDYAKRVARYMAFLGLEPDSTQAKAIMSRLMQSSTQFLFCDNAFDWACLESTPVSKPSVPHRRDAAEGLGTPVLLSEPLAVEYFFTTQWDIDDEVADPTKMLALQLADKIKTDGKDGIWMALYGIDDTQKWMKPVYDALTQKVQEGVPTQGVFDTEGLRDGVPAPLTFSVTQPEQETDGRWIFDAAEPPKTNMAFQYANTVDLIKEMNKNASSDDQAPARLEYPDDAIMHNKFFVMKNGDKLSVWSGTANVSETCMGSERNTNMAVYIKNNEIAQTFKDEFDEMFAYQDEPFADPERFTNAVGGEGLKLGRFHRRKTPNTRRFFRSPDGTDVHVHFAPTDDAEHRMILPLILTAKSGDEIRVAMFGGGGLELVRAFQLAASRGVKVRIVMDRLTGSNLYSWIKDASANVMEPNPFSEPPSGELSARLSNWKGLNHHKTATFTRKRPGGKRAEVIIVGSQNWSKQGNDENDENMVTLMNTAVGLPMAAAFNEHFDQKIWPASKEVE